MDVNPDAPAERSTSASTVVSYPTLGRPVPRDDWFLLWGPLGMMVAVAFAVVAILWRRLNTVQERNAADNTALNKKIQDMGEAHAEKIEELGREHAANFQALTEKFHALAGSLRDVLDATGKRIIR